MKSLQGVAAGCIHDSVQTKNTFAGRQSVHLAHHRFTKVFFVIVSFCRLMIRRSNLLL